MAKSGERDLLSFWRRHVHPVISSFSNTVLSDKEMACITGFVSDIAPVFEEHAGLAPSSSTGRYYELLGDLWRYRLRFESRLNLEAVYASRAFYLKALTLRPTVGRISAQIGFLSFTSKHYLEALHFFYRSQLQVRPAKEAPKLIDDLLLRCKHKKNGWIGLFFEYIRHACKGKGLSSQRQQLLLSVFQEQFPGNLGSYAITQHLFYASTIFISAAECNPSQRGPILLVLAEVCTTLFDREVHCALLPAYLLAEYIYQESLLSCLHLFSQPFWSGLARLLNKQSACASKAAPLNLVTALRGQRIFKFDGIAADSSRDWQDAFNAFECDLPSMLYKFCCWARRDEGEKPAFLSEYLLWDEGLFSAVAPRVQSDPQSTHSLDRAIESLKICRDNFLASAPAGKELVPSVAGFGAAKVIFDTNIWLYRLDAIKEIVCNYSDIEILVPVVVLQELKALGRRGLERSAIAEASLVWLASPHFHVPGKLCGRLATVSDAPPSLPSVGRVRTVTSSGDIIPGIQIAGKASSVSNNDDVLLRICNKQAGAVFVTDDFNLINKARLYSIPAFCWRDFSRAFL